MVDFPRMFRETHVRSVAKALSWRLLGTLATTALVFVFTRRLALSLAVGGLEFASKIALFWFHERAWERIRYGREEVAPAVVWLTGLSGAGKSAIARDVFEGLRRRGYPPEALVAFCKHVGVAKFNSTHEHSLLEFFVRDHLNKTALRRMAVLDPLRLCIDNWPAGSVELGAVEELQVGVREEPEVGDVDPEPTPTPMPGRPPVGGRL